MRRASPIASLGLLVCAFAVIALSHHDGASAVGGEAHALTPTPKPAASADSNVRTTATTEDLPASAEARALTDGQPLDVNCATEADLVLLPRIGPALAARIVAHRTTHGPFSSVEALQLVRGIGPRTIALIRPLATVERCPATPP